MYCQVLYLGVLVFLFTSNVVLGKVFTDITFMLGAERSNGRNCFISEIYIQSIINNRSSPRGLEMCQCVSSVSLQCVFKKGSEKDACNYRPVSPTSVPCRIMAHIIFHHIMGHLDAHHVLVS